MCVFICLYMYICVNLRKKMGHDWADPTEDETNQLKVKGVNCSVTSMTYNRLTDLYVYYLCSIKNIRLIDSG